MGRVRKFSREQGDRTVRRKFDGFLQGMNVDSDPCALEQGEMAYLKNTIGFRGELKVRPGYVSSTLTGALPSGTWRSVLAHPANGYGFISADDGLFRVDLSTNVVTKISALGGACELHALGNEVLALGASTYYVTENGGASIREAYRSASVVNPTVNTEAEGNFKYRFLFTYARVASVDGIVTVIQETPSKFVSGTTLDDYVESIRSEAMTQNSFPKFGAIANPGDPWTHIGVYRTLNIGVGDLGTGLPENGSEAYYRLGFFPFVSGQSLSLTGYSIGEMAIGGSGDNKFRVGPYYAALGATDAELLSGQAPLLATRLMRPLPPTQVAKVVPGFLVFADGQQMKYSQTNTPSTQFLYDPATQFLDFDDDIGCLQESGGYIVAGCKGKTAIVSHTSYTNTENTTLGLYSAVLSNWKIADYTIGVGANKNACALPGGEVIALCSDGSVRIWNGTAWSSDFTANKVSSIVKGNTSCLISCDPKHGVILALGSRVLRYGLNEAMGVGWSEYSDTASRFLQIPVSIPQDGSRVEFWGANKRTKFGGAFSDDGIAISTEQHFPGCTGEEADYYCRSNEFSLVAHLDALGGGYSLPTVTGKFYADGYLQQSATGTPTSAFVRFLPSVDGNYLQARTSFSSSNGLRILAAYFHYQVQDRQIDLSSSPESTYGKSLASAVKLGFDTRFPKVNATDGTPVVAPYLYTGRHSEGSEGYDYFTANIGAFSEPFTLIAMIPGRVSTTEVGFGSNGAYWYANIPAGESLLLLVMTSVSGVRSIKSYTEALVETSYTVSTGTSTTTSAQLYAKAYAGQGWKAYAKTLSASELAYIQNLFITSKLSEL